MNYQKAQPDKQLTGSEPEHFGQIDLYAHRGSTILAPENTAQAFELALDHGADVLEIDVRLSRDGQVMVTHDARVERTCNGHGAVADMTLSTLKQLDAAHNFSDLQGKPHRGEGVQLITLDEMFERFPGIRINVDIKDNSARAAQAVADSIERSNSQARVNVGSFHATALGHFRKRAPGVTTAATQAEVAQLYFLGRKKTHALPFEFLQIPISYFGIPLASNSFIRAARGRGINIVYWTINTTEAMQFLLRRGAHGIVTDRIDLASKLLGRTSDKTV